MTSYEFQSTLYRCERDMLAAIVDQWISADGSNDAATVREILAEQTDEQIVAEILDGWGLDKGEDRGWGDEAPSHMQEHGYTADDLAAAVARYRAASAA